MSQANNNPIKLVDAISHFIHKNFVLLLLASYALAAIFPKPGLFIRDISLAKHMIFGEQVNFSGPMLLLSLLLFNAGFAIKIAELRELKRKTNILIAGLLGNILAPILFILFVWTVITHWHNSDEVQNILVGLALIASMPVAGSSTAWAQNANGNLALSIGLILFSTLLSPLITPMILHSASWITTGDYAEDLIEIAQTGSKIFLTLAVVLPVSVGLLLKLFVHERSIDIARPLLKLFNSLFLLLLIYSNACVSLPQVIAQPDWDFLGLILVITVSLCLFMFAAGLFISRIFKVSENDKVALVFALGMNNNGTGLVLASMTLGDHPSVLLPIVIYNLIQHLIAGIVDYTMFKKLIE